MTVRETGEPFTFRRACYLCGKEGRNGVVILYCFHVNAATQSPATLRSSAGASGALTANQAIFIIAIMRISRSECLLLSEQSRKSEPKCDKAQVACHVLGASIVTIIVLIISLF